jgi:hypothetical protein
VLLATCVDRGQQGERSLVQRLGLVVAPSTRTTGGALAKAGAHTTADHLPFDKPAEGAR